MTLIEAHELTKKYPDGTEALRGVSFAIEENEFVAIMGPSGSGKSTLMHILGFLDKQSSGEYRFRGKASDEYDERSVATVRNTEIGFVFQQFNLLPRASVFENVIMPLYYSDVPPNKWRELGGQAIDAVGLSHRVEHESYQLSGGEKQRVAMARAIINNPEVVFADEPTGNLDTKAGEQVIEILRGLYTSGHTVILVTHDEEIAAYAKRTLRVRDGKLEADTKV